MPRIKHSCIEDISQRVSLVDVAGAYTQMKRAGAQFRGLSPFNAEKSPSFFVHPEKNVFKDYSSGNAGNLFRFVQLKENLSFPEAVEFLAQRFGIPLEYEDNGMPPERMSLRKELFAIHEAATDFFHRCFLEDKPEAVAMRHYWYEERGFKLELAKDFKIGYAPPNGALFTQHMGKHGFSLEALRESGLLYLNEHARNLDHARARFRGRLMIPIRDVQGRVIAFTARVTELTPQDDPSREAKYINSPETAIFLKGHLLFGLDRARTAIHDNEPMVMVEGQLDCLRCWEQGIRNAVAPQGTAITEHQMALIRRYTPVLECLLDGDAAGQRAALRALPLALKTGLEIRFLVLPPGGDPDDLLRSGGPAALEKLREEAQPAMVYLARTLLPNPQAASPTEKAEALKQAYAIIRECDSQVVQAGYLEELSPLLKVEAGAVRRDFATYQRTSNRAAPAANAPVEVIKEKLTNVEAELLYLVLHHHSLTSKISKVIDTEWINNKTTGGRLIARILAAHEENEWAGPENIDTLLETDEENNYAYQILTDETPVEDPVNAANECLQRLFLRHIKARQQQIERSILNETSPERKQELFAERISLRAQLKNIPTIQ